MEGNGRRRQSKQTNSGLGQGKDRGLQRSHVDSTHTHTHASHLSLAHLSAKRRGRRGYDAACGLFWCWAGPPCLIW